IVVLGDHAAHHHAGKIVEAREHRLLHRAADVLEIDVDAGRAGAVERGAEAGVAMVEAGIESQLLDDVAALVSPAGNADCTSAGDLRQLADDGADRARGGGDDQRLALGRLGYRRGGDFEIIGHRRAGRAALQANLEVGGAVVGHRADPFPGQAGGSRSCGHLPAAATAAFSPASGLASGRPARHRGAAAAIEAWAKATVAPAAKARSAPTATSVR